MSCMTDLFAVLLVLLNSHFCSQGLTPSSRRLLIRITYLFQMPHDVKPLALGRQVDLSLIVHGLSLCFVAVA